jgi:hypothetical protein
MKVIFNNFKYLQMAQSTMHRIDVDRAPYSHYTFLGRLRYFAWITDPRLALLSNKRLYEARDLLGAYRSVDIDFHLIHLCKLICLISLLYCHPKFQSLFLEFDSMHNGKGKTMAWNTRNFLSPLDFQLDIDRASNSVSLTYDYFSAISVPWAFLGWISAL